MFIVQNYPLAVIFCIITMLCWGSWANTQKLAGKTWRFELFYWDYVIGIVLFSLLSALTLGSFGKDGRSFFADLQQADSSNIMSALLGGFIFNAANILFSAAIAIAGMAVAFPIAIGLALVLGVIVNYAGSQKGDPVFLFIGVGLVAIAIIINAIAYRKASTANQQVSTKGIIISLIAGVLMSFFYRFIAASMDLENFSHPCCRQDDSVYSSIYFLCWNFSQQFYFQYHSHEKTFTGSTYQLCRIFQRKFSPSHGGCTRWIDLGAWKFFESYCGW